MIRSKLSIIPECVICVASLTAGELHAAEAAPAGTLPTASQTPPAPSPGSTAEDRTAYAVEDIVVTAQKREQRLQDVPVAVTAISGSELARTGINNVENLQAVVPNFSLGQSGGVARVTLRGIGLANISTGAEGSIAFHVNNVFISRGAAAFGSFYDLERIEVLRGPQGTLFGRNATGGSINVITRKPTSEFSGYGQATIGNYDRLAFEGAVGGPIVGDVVLARLAFQTEDRSGYGKNIVTGRDIDDANQRSIRGSLELRPSERMTIDIVADLHEEHDRAFGFHYFGPGAEDLQGNVVTPIGLLLGGITAPDPRDLASDTDPRNDRKFWGVLVDARYDLGFSELRSISSYRKTRYRTESDLDGTSVAFTSPWVQFENARQVSQELQLVGDSADWTWLGGLFYFHEKLDGNLLFPINDVFIGGPGVLRQGLAAGGMLKTDAAAAFGQVSYKLTPTLKLTVGGRYSWEKKSVDEKFAFDLFRPYDRLNPVIPFIRRTDDKSFSSFTPRVALDYQPNPDLLLYASWSKGFKSGTYNLGGVQAPLSPEKVQAFEGGIKSTFADRRIQANIAGFYYEYTDLQVGKVINNLIALENAATATIYGAELEIHARPVDSLRADLSFSYLNAKFDEYISADNFRPAGDGVTVDPVTGAPAFNLAGNTVPQAPEFTIFAGAEYLMEVPFGTFSLRGEVLWTDRVYFSAFNRTNVSQPSRTILNAFLNFADDAERWNFSIYGKNLSNKTYATDMIVSVVEAGGPINGSVGEPRTYGMSVRYNF